MQQTYIVDPRFELRGIENPSVSLNNPKIWDQLYGTGGTNSGINITPDSALGIGAVFQAVNLISGDVAKLPLNVYQRRPDLGDKGREVANNHPAQRLIKYRPNSEMSAFKFWRRLMTHALLWSNAYAYIIRDGSGRPVELLPLLPDRTKPMRTPEGDLFFASEIGGEVRGIPASNILHIEQISIDGMKDCELVKKAREAFALALSAEKFASKYFSNGGRMGGILEINPGVGDTARDNLEAGFRKTYDSSDAAFKTVILRDGSKFHQAQFTPEQTQMTSAREQQVKEVARWFNIPPHKLGDDSKASYNSLEQENRAYLSGCLSHWLRTIDSECYLKLLSPTEQNQNSHFIEFNVSALIAADIATQYDIYRKGIEAGILSPDEVRAMQNLNPRPDGLGGKYLRPLNMEYADHVEPVDTEPPASDSDERFDGSLIESAKAVLDESVSRFVAYLVRKVNREAKQKTDSRFITWMDGAYADESEGLRKEIMPAATMYAKVTGSTAEKVIESIDRYVIAGMKTEIDTVLNTANSEQFRAALQTITNEFNANAIANYSEVLK
jgi:HK97 family phage portal protein